MLEALADGGWIGAARARPISAAAYRFLRTVEHRLQMVADEQTHTLPAEREELERFARFAGFGGSRRVRRQCCSAICARCSATTPGCSRTRPRPRLSAARWLSRARRTTARRSTSSPPWASASRWRPRRTVRALARRRLPRSLKGEFARTPSCRARAGADRSAWRGPRTRTARWSRSTASSPDCTAARGCSRCCGRTPTWWRWSRCVLGTAPRLADILAQHPQAMDALLEPSFFGALPDEAEALGRARRAALERGALLRGLPRPAAHVRPGAHVPDRRAHPLGHGVGRAGGRGFRDGSPTWWSARCIARSRTSSPRTTAASAASRARCSRSASSAAAR